MNVKGEVKGNQLVLTIDIGTEALAAARGSSTGKSLLVGTTGGYTGFGPVKVSLNAITNENVVAEAKAELAKRKAA